MLFCSLKKKKKEKVRISNSRVSIRSYGVLNNLMKMMLHEVGPSIWVYVFMSDLLLFLFLFLFVFLSIPNNLWHLANDFLRLFLLAFLKRYLKKKSCDLVTLVKLLLPFPTTHCKTKNKVNKTKPSIIKHKNYILQSLLNFLRYIKFWY